MKLSFALWPLRAAKRRVNENDQFRWWPLYSACLAAFMYSTWFWPRIWDWQATLGAYLLYPWLLDVENIPWTVGCGLCVVLGVVGLFRSNWFARGLAAYGVWMGWFYLPRGWNPVYDWWRELTWYTFDVPGKWIHGYAGEGTLLASFLWCVYLAVVWVAIRPLMKRVWVRVLRLEARILERWPAMNRFAKPVM